MIIQSLFAAARRAGLLVAGLCLSLLAGCSKAPEPTPPTPIPGLGSVSFPVTTQSAEARQAFERGTLLLHLFHYGEARQSFRNAEAADSGFTMAYWGEAMAWNYAVWNMQQPDSARLVLAKLAPTPAARRQAARSAREAGYLGAVEILYGTGPKPARDTLYEAAMAKLTATYPKDDEAKLFHALSLLGLNQGVRDVPTYLRAADIADSVFRRHPDNPGASHYLIHALDDPAHAARGLEAARALAQYSPDAGHAQHMTSHIFLALGMWEDVVAANENTMRVMGQQMAAHGHKISACGHGQTWLTYGYLQLGRLDTAKALVRACQREAEADASSITESDKDPDASSIGSAVYVWSRYIIDTEAWSGEDIGWNPGLDRGTTAPAADYHFTQAFAAARRGDLNGCRERTERFQAARAALQQKERAEDPGPETDQYLSGLAVLDLELQGLLLLGSGDERGIATLRRATALEDSMAYAFGPPTVNKPSHELLGEELARLGRPAEAEPEFRAALERTPRRAAVVRGLGQALAAQGKPAQADSLAALTPR
jgi:tetratricopeptide (TPR) repeat protein